MNGWTLRYSSNPGGIANERELFLRTFADEEFVDELKQSPVFTYTQSNVVGKVRLCMEINPAYESKEVNDVIDAAVANLMTRSALGTPVQFTSRGADRFTMYLPTHADQAFVDELRQSPVFIDISDPTGASFVVRINPVYGAAGQATRVAMKAVANLQRRRIAAQAAQDSN